MNVGSIWRTASVGGVEERRSKMNFPFFGGSGNPCVTSRRVHKTTWSDSLKKHKWQIKIKIIIIRKIDFLLFFCFLYFCRGSLDTALSEDMFQTVPDTSSYVKVRQRRLLDQVMLQGHIKSASFPDLWPHFSIFSRFSISKKRFDYNNLHH